MRTYDLLVHNNPGTVLTCSPVQNVYVLYENYYFTIHERNNINKYASYPDWRNPHMPIAVTASGGQFVTRASRLPGYFVAPG